MPVSKISQKRREHVPGMLQRELQYNVVKMVPDDLKKELRVLAKIAEDCH